MDTGFGYNFNKQLRSQEKTGCTNCTLNNVCNSKDRCQKIKEMDATIQNQGITIADLEICFQKLIFLDIKNNNLAEQIGHLKKEKEILIKELISQNCLYIQGIGFLTQVLESGE